MHKKITLINCAVLALLANMSVSTVVNAAPLQPGGFSFGLWGDMPYAKNGDGTKTGIGSDKMTRLVNSINAANVAFTIFDGDTKDGSSICTDAALGQESIDLFNSLAKPVVYIPGDNEWTDCHRINNGGYNGLERLNYLRTTMFDTEYSFGQKKMKLHRQGVPGQLYSENSRWTRGNIVFLGLNIPGSNNNKVNAGECISSKSVRTQVECDADNAEYAARDAANIAFMQESFQYARDNLAAGVMIVMQADPVFDLPETETYNERTNVGTPVTTLPTHDGYDAFLAALVTETKNFSGQVVLVHGDTHFYKVDKPLMTQADLVKNFTRVETFGSPNVHWIKVIVKPNDPNVFVFEPMIVPGN